MYQVINFNDDGKETNVRPNYKPIEIVEGSRVDQETANRFKKPHLGQNLTQKGFFGGRKSYHTVS